MAASLALSTLATTGATAVTVSGEEGGDINQGTQKLLRGIYSREDSDSTIDSSKSDSFHGAALASN
jgi:hypothetical protein